MMFKVNRISIYAVFQVVLITGASSGIGESLAHEFYKAGCQLILAARKKDELERVKAELVLIETVCFHFRLLLPCFITQ